MLSQSETSDNALLAAGLEAFEQSALEKALCLLLQAKAQAEFDGTKTELVKALIALGKVQRDLGEPDGALEVLDQALDVSQALANPLFEADVLNQRAGVQHGKGEYALAWRDLELALDIARKGNDERRVVNCLINVGIVATKLADFPRALAALREAHALVRDRVQDQHIEAQCLTNLGLLFEAMGDDVRALEACQQGLEALSGLGHRNLEAIMVVNLGVVQKRLGQTDVARASFEQALTLARLSGFVKVEISALDGLGQIQAERGELGLALDLHHQALLRSRETGDGESETDVLLSLGRDHLLNHDPQQARTVLLNALGLVEHLGRRTAQREAHMLLAEAFEAIGDLPQALRHFRQHQALLSQLFNEERESKTRQLTIQFDLERARHAAEVYRLRTEFEREAKERAEAMVKQRTHELELGHQTIAAQGRALQEKVENLHQSLSQNEGLRQRLVQAATRSATLNERMLRRLSADLHDGPAQDLGFALLKLGGDAIYNTSMALPETARQQFEQELEHIGSSISRALCEMRAIASGMCLPELETLSLSETTRRVIAQHERRARIKVRLALDLPEHDQTPLAVKITLYRLIQESLTNAYKHGGQGQSVSLCLQEDQLFLVVSDNGPGFDLQTTLAQGEHLGLLGMRERVEGLGGVFAVRTAPEAGTKVQIRLPLKTQALK